MEVYLDNSATTRTDDKVIDLMSRIMRDDYGNPSSMHNKGFNAEKYIRSAKETFAGLFKCSDSEIFFTSGGTESNNWALIGTAAANSRKGRHILVSPFEHPSVSAPLKILEDEGFEIEQLRVDRTGIIDMDDLKNKIRNDTILVSVMTVNNETGTLQDTESIGRLVKDVNKDTLFHTDAVQAFGKIRLVPGKIKADLISVSSHKLHGPKGAGLLYIGKGVRIRPLIFGGGQQNDMRSGTENVPGIAGFALAAGLAYQDQEAETARIRSLKDELAEGLKAIPGTVINGRLDNKSAPHILNVSFTGVRSEVMLHALEEKEIYVSAGSACSSHKKEKSPTLKALGCSNEEMDSAIRFSLSKYNTEQEIEYTVNTIKELKPYLGRFVRR